MGSEGDAYRKQVEEALAGGKPLPNFPEVSPLRSLAMAQMEVVGEYEKEGFSRSESLYLTAAMFNGNPGIPPPSS